jgi:hypothetical protein
VIVPQLQFEVSMRRVRIVLTLTLVVVAPVSAQPRAVKTDPYSLAPSTPTDALGLTNFDTFVGTCPWELPTRTNRPVLPGSAPIPGFVQDLERESVGLLWTARSSDAQAWEGNCTATWTGSRGWL